ncbi:hypothetical protein [Corynebacterium urealyticum]|uniref:hypothetical protein n=1 Tax=Corynebacterium urealyticum TaxID=43771 RepID=UPI00293F5F78|nr:hypothetical protein [Corynebacterium urealyticum]WOH94982.1 hypothetical protein RZ943_03030 [Corynebacterium urealyticum]
MQLTIQGNGVTHDVRVVVPERDEVDFLDLLDDVYEWEPEQVSAVKLAAREARRSAEEAAGSAGEAGRIAAAFRGAERLEGWAESASGAAASAASSAGEAASSAEAAAGSASEAEQSASSAASSAATADSHAKRAGTHANQAGSHASAASESAKAADASATAAAGSAGKAKAEADRATRQASAASTSAGEAKQHADRAEGVVDTVRWDDDKLTVAGKTSPSLRGPKGDKGEQGDSGASTWDAVSGKPNTFPPTAHQHKMKDITDLPRITSAASLSTIMQRDSNGRALIYSEVAPQQPYHVTHKKYVDDQDKSTLAEARALVETRAVVKQVTSPPSRPEPGVLYVIPE